MEDRESLPPCPKYGVGTVVIYPNYGRGRVVGYQGDHYVILFKGEGTKLIPFTFEGLVPEDVLGDPDQDRVRQAVREALLDYGWIEADLEMGKRWAGGKLVLVPGNEATQPKEIPLEVFFKKITTVREKLRVLEQKLNNHPELSPEDKLDLQGYLTRCYGALTSFNVLFADKESHFRGQNKET